MPFFIPSRIADNISLSLAILLAGLLMRALAEWLVGRTGDTALRHRRRFTVRALGNSVLVLALLGVWMSEIQSVVLSLAAVMVALVVATKELIMCAAGSMLRLGGHLFKVGDRIEMNGLRGEVVDHGLFSTRLAELPPPHLGSAGTGRVVTVPNSILLTAPVRVEAQPRQFAPHRFAITLDHGVPPGPALAILEEAAERALGPGRERAARFHRLSAAKSGADIAGPGFETSVRTTDLGKLQFAVMAYCLAGDAPGIEAAITLEFLDRVLGAAGEGAGGAVPKETRPAASPAEARAWAEIARQLREPPRPREDAA